MTGAVGGSKNSSNNNSGGSFNQGVWGGQAPWLEGMYRDVGNMFGGSMGGMQDNMDQGRGYTNEAMQGQINGANDAMGGGAYKDMNLAGNLMDSLNQSQNQPSNMQEINSMIMGGSGNNYADAMKGQFMNNANEATANMLGNMDARAASSGMSGGARHGTAIANGMDDINRNLQNNMADVGYNTFDKDLDRKLNIANMADQNNFGRQQLMGDMLNNQQNTQNFGTSYGSNIFGQGMGMQMQPWQAAGAYSGAMGAPTVLGNGDYFGSGNSKGKGMSASGGAPI